MSDKKILALEFCEITGGSIDDANRLLKKYKWELQEAVEHYFAQGATKSPAKKTTKKSEIKPQHREDDEIPAELLEGEDHVRAPMEFQSGVISEDPTGHAFLQPKRRGFNSKTPKPIFESFRDFKSEAKLLESKNKKTDSKEQKITELFVPPLDLITDCTFQEAKDKGTQELRWLIVNIQNTKEFNSHRLNRDTWKNEKLKRLLKDHFIFWQQYDDSPQGKQFIFFYPNSSMVPYIGIIDPRTGEEIKSWFSFVEPEVLFKDLSDFICANTLDDDIAPSTRALETVPLVSRNVMDLSEEDQLKMAIQQSLDREKKVVESKSPLVADLYSSSDSESENSQSFEEEPQIHHPKKLKTEKPVEKPQKSANENGKHEIRTTEITAKSEPIIQPKSTPVPRVLDCALQIRETNGNTLKQEFSSEDRVVDVVNFVQKNRTDNLKSEIFLMMPFPRKRFDTKESLNQTLKQADLVPKAVLHVVVKD